jgi:hypothetical protein
VESFTKTLAKEFGEVKSTGGSPKLLEAPIEKVRSLEVPSEALESHLIQDKRVLGVEVVVNGSDNIK